MADTATITSDGTTLTLTVKSPKLQVTANATIAFSDGTTIKSSYSLVKPPTITDDSGRSWVVKSNDGATLVATTGV